MRGSPASARRRSGSPFPDAVPASIRTHDMESIASEKSTFERFGAARRRTVRLSRDTVVKTSLLDTGAGFPLLVEPAVDNPSLASWIASTPDSIEEQLLRYGAILFRHFPIASAAEFQQVAAALSPDLLDYEERAAPRRQVAANVFTSSE